MTNDAPTAASAERRSYYVAGEPIELWENSDAPFGWSVSDLETYATTERWELLFNALVLSSIAEATQQS
jgi:hypothetical protein